ncbi:hypothetical protein FACS1894122_04920 [Alphaproteobacteria bacterium]|nr:hypothetical protein FACS1894122_04920 [Alphaproteobacteria bacterium]
MDINLCVQETAEVIIDYDMLIGGGTTENRGHFIVNALLSLGENGRIFNYGLFSGFGTIQNDGVIHSRRGFVFDEENIAGNFLREDYDVSALASEERKRAAYFDLTNETKIEKFYTSPKFGVRVFGNYILPLPGEEQDFLKDERNTKTSAFFLESGYNMILNCNEDKECPASIVSLKGYSGGNIGAVDPVDHTVILEKIGGARLHITGENSWYNGVFNIREGVVDVATEGSMFGGDINLYGGSELIWRGGPKDQYNKPTITLHNGSTLSFILPEDVNNKVFSVYGQIKTDANYNQAGVSPAVVNIESGTIYIKSDCSKFYGELEIEPNATLIIRKDENNEGQMFGGSVSVTNGKSILIDTDQGLSPMHIKKGKISLENKSELNNGGKIKKMTVEKDATIHNNIDHADFYNLTIDGGTLEFGEWVESATFHGPTYFGSTLDTRDGKIMKIVCVEDRVVGEEVDYPAGEDHGADNGRLKIGYRPDGSISGGNMEWLLDFDPQSGKADSIEAVGVDIAEGSQGIILARYKLLSEPTEEAYIFQLLTLTGPGEPYPHLTVTDQTYDAASGTYRLYAEGGNGCVTLRKEAATGEAKKPVGGNQATEKPNEMPAEETKKPDGGNPTTEKPNTMPAEETKKPDEAEKSINSDYLPIRLLHCAMLSNLVNIHDALYETFPEYYANTFGRGHRIWGKSFINSCNIDTIQNKKIDISGYSIILGCDMKAIAMKNNFSIVPTIFVAYSREDLAYCKRTANSDCVVTGIKTALFNNHCSIEAIGSYGFIGTHGYNGKENCGVKSHVFSAAAKGLLQVPLHEKITLNLNLAAYYSYALTEDFEFKCRQLRHKNLSSTALLPGLNLQIGDDKFKTTIGTRFNKRFGGEIETSFDGKPVQAIDRISNDNFESQISIIGKIGKFTEANLEINKIIGSRKGFSARLTLFCVIS